MRISLVMRATPACVATIVFSLSLAPSSARMGAPVGRPAFGPGHFSHFTPRGFNRRFDFDRFGFNRFGPNRFDRFGANRFNRFGFNRFGLGAFGGNQLSVGGWGWADWGGSGYWGGPVSTAASEPIIVGDGAPVIINVGADPSSGGAGYGGGCVTHKLIYDSDGKYVGERQTSQC